MFLPKRVLYEKDSENYELGQYLLNLYKSKGIKCDVIENHNNIEEMRKKENSEFRDMKQNLIIGIRKTHKFVENHKISDYLVPYTSSGCIAMCLYCYLVCNFNKCSYLRLFVNREEMLNKIIKVANNTDDNLVFEIGSNSDLILENTITNNLIWTIENFAKSPKGMLTFPTKFGFLKPFDKAVWCAYNTETRRPIHKRTNPDAYREQSPAHFCTGLIGRVYYGSQRR